MIKLVTLEQAEPRVQQLNELKQYAAVPDNSRDALLNLLLKRAMAQVQDMADITLLPATLELTITDRDDNTPVRLYQTLGEVLSVVDGKGQDVPFSVVGNAVVPNFYTKDLVITYKTRNAGQESISLLAVVYQYATALYDGATPESLAQILRQC